MELKRTLTEFSQLIDTIYELLQDENRLLRNDELPNERILNEKTALLPQINDFVVALQEINSDGGSLRATDEDRALKAKLEQKMLALFLLDRENEKLLLKQSTAKKSEGKPNRGVSLKMLQDAYKKNL